MRNLTALVMLWGGSCLLIASTVGVVYAAGNPCKGQVWEIENPDGSIGYGATCFDAGCTSPPCTFGLTTDGYKFCKCGDDAPPCCHLEFKLTWGTPATLEKRAAGECLPTVPGCLGYPCKGNWDVDFTGTAEYPWEAACFPHL